MRTKKISLLFIVVIISLIFSACSLPNIPVATPTQGNSQETATPVITSTLEPTPTIAPTATPTKIHFEFKTKVLPEYGKEFLGDMVDDYFKAIDALYSGASTVQLENVDTEDQFEKLRRALIVFFIPKNILYDYNYIKDNGPFAFDVKTKTLTIKYSLDKEEYLAKIDEFKALVEKIITDNVVDLSDEFTTAKELFRYVTKKVTYNNDHILEVYDALTKGEGFCQTYSGMYQYLLWQTGIEAYLYGNYDHMWNIVKIDGEYYHMDTTWDDGNFYYFGMNDEKCFGEAKHKKGAEILNDALLDGKAKVMPCTSDKFNNYDFFK